MNIQITGNGVWFKDDNANSKFGYVYFLPNAELKNLTLVDLKTKLEQAIRNNKIEERKAIQ